MIHICTNCYKTFKTIQHLNQHKNRKHKCKPFTENMCYIQSKTLSESKNDSNKLESGVLNGNHSSGETTDDDCGIIGNNNISSNSSIVTEGSPVNSSVENLSITNLLEFVNAHKKILEEKNKLESTLVILKKHLETLTSENNELKNKMSIVNDFISVYKTSSNNSNKNQLSV